jgi:hypothetical protein
MSFTLLSFAFLTQETGPYDISQYPHPLGKAADGTENSDKEARALPEMSPSKSRNSTVLIEEVIESALKTAIDGGLPPLMPMIVLSEDCPYNIEGEDYEIARDSHGKWTAQDISTEHIAINSDTSPYQFNRHFRDKAHENYIGYSKSDNPVVLSFCFDDKGPYEPVYRIIIRTASKTWHNEYTAKGFAQKPSVWDFVLLEQEGSNEDELALDDLQLIQDHKAPELLQKFDEHTICTRYKFGVLYQKYGQKTEGEMFGNESHSEAMEEFLNLLGDRVKLKGFKHYKAGLDTNSDMTGKESVYTTFQGKEIMFHVSTLLPYEPLDRQQIERKRHIGNDVVTIIFQDENTPFCPSSIRSHFLHAFIVVQVEHPNCSDTVYKVSVAARNILGTIEPALPVPAVFKKGQEFRDFLLTKLINAEIVARGTSKFKELNMRTRQQLLVQLVREVCPNPEKKKRGRYKSDNLLDHRAKAKRKQSINLGSLLLGRVKDVSSEYLLSPRSGRKKAPEIVHMVPDVGEGETTVSSEDPTLDKLKTQPSKSESGDLPLLRSSSTQIGSDTSDADIASKEFAPMRARAHSHGDGSKSSLNNGENEAKRKTKKSILSRVKTFSTKRKIRHSIPTDNNVTLVGIAPGDDSSIHSMEDVRMSSSSEQIWGSSKPVMYRPVSEVSDDNTFSSNIKDSGFPLSQSVPSSPVTTHRSFSYTSAALQSSEQKPLYTISPKEQSPFKSGISSPLAHASASSLRRPKSISVDSFTDHEEKSRHVRNVGVQTTVAIGSSPFTAMNNDTLGLLLKKIEELNGEVAKMRKENFDLLKKQAVCTVFRNYCIEQVVSLQYHT